ncbi:MAG: hypothetical protein DDT34_00215 [Firmicutes bacterium]|nr:hypothetical protein [Bacillota bacterium]
MAVKRKTTHPQQLTVGMILPRLLAVCATTAALWAIFHLALAADKAVADAAATVQATTTVQLMSGGLTATRLECIETGEGC